ncbi:hypothetical protein V7S43_005593 [Phytophthora oleae]|uniref:Uncharacterized protein n=1 Tax=Phytophthora oleae TaxID=2107226 RepID=A0ABD3FQK1_9STRA
MAKERRSRRLFRQRQQPNALPPSSATSPGRLASLPFVKPAMSTPPTPLSSAPALGAVSPMGTSPSSWISQQGYIPPSPLLSGTPSSSPYSDVVIAQAALASVEITSLSSASPSTPVSFREYEATPAPDASADASANSTCLSSDCMQGDFVPAGEYGSIVEKMKERVDEIAVTELATTANQI